MIVSPWESVVVARTAIPVVVAPVVVPVVVALAVAAAVPAVALDRAVASRLSIEDSMDLDLLRIDDETEVGLAPDTAVAEVYSDERELQSAEASLSRELEKD